MPRLRPLALYLTEADVARLLTPRDAIEAVEDSFRRLAAGTIENVPRYRVRLGDGGALAVMSAVDRERGLACVKTYTATPRGRRSSSALFEGGELRAVIEADRLGQLRTGAASAVAARYLARPGARTLGVIGCGLQARSQVACIREALPGDRGGGRVLPRARSAGASSARRSAPSRARATAIRGRAGRRRHDHDLARPGAPRRVASAGCARLRGRREPAAGARARQRGARARGVRLLRLARRREGRVRRPDRAGGAGRARLARGARAPGGGRRRGRRAASRTTTSSSSSRTGSPPGTSRSRRVSSS